MISYLIRRALGPGVNGFWTGLTMVLVGVALTVFSAVISDALGFRLTLVFYGLIVFGILRMVVGIPALLGGRRAQGQRQYASSGPAVPAYFAPPFEVTPGYCWQCGGRVKRSATICLNCGATQAAEKEEQPAGAEDYPPSNDVAPMPPPARLPATNGPRPAGYRPGRAYGDDAYGPGPARASGGYGGYGSEERYGPSPSRAYDGRGDGRGTSRRGSRS